MTARIKKPTTINLRSLVLPAAIAAATFSAGASAGDPNYNHFQLNYTSHDYGVLSDELSGFEISASKMLDDLVFAYGEYFTVEETFSNHDVELKSITVGVGYTREIDAKTDFSARFMYIDQEITAYIGDVGKEGFGASVGAHYAVMDELDLTAEILMDDVEDSDITFTFGTIYTFPQNISAIGEVSHSDDGETISIGARYSY